MGKVKIAPSMMCADFINLKKDLDVFKETKVDYLHIDVMDGHYVPNITLGADFCRALDEYSDIPLDIHLMIENVDKYVPDFAQFKNAIVCFHPEVSYHPIRTIQLIKSFGAAAGIGIDPGMSLDTIKDLLPYVNIVCIMTVSPGYAGQKVIPEAMDKIKIISDYIKANKLNVEIEVDGNVSWEHIPKMVENGAEILVSGSSSLYDKKAELKDNIIKMQSMLD